LEQYGFPVINLHPEDFHAPLKDKVDVVVLTDDARMALEGDEAGRGGRGAGGAARATRPEYAYAMTSADLRAFEQFVRGGGTVVCLNSAADFAIQQFRLAVRNVGAGLRPEEFFSRGSIFEVTTDPRHQVMAGMPEEASVFFDTGPVFDTLTGFQGAVLARYQESGSPLQSGYLNGEKYLQGKAAAVD